jgi:antitoxin component YwqK of YwqJK toxin-antitoxin module
MAASVVAAERMVDLSTMQVHGGLAYTENETELYTGAFTQHYSNGQLKTVTRFENGRQHGLS